eukprot:TRINITY_DN7233_c0_g1_i3.p2 TRINITY_DN7233_c0_g1~~TRINITY_DN7233_c0_g1_i3.p2  ORF type:complete len:143 (-),score=34.63 TRINITY_DN7233_c0_g1_i3:93-521(-)
MGVSCCGCAERKTTAREDKGAESSKETLKHLLSTIDSRSPKTEIALESSKLQQIKFTQDPGLMDALGIANEYWRNSRIKQYDDQIGKTFRYQIAGLVRGEKHIYTSSEYYATLKLRFVWRVFLRKKRLLTFGSASSCAVDCL